MTKDFVFTYANSYDSDTQGCYPNSTSVKIEHEFEDETTWDVILYQMCKFLEATGYVGITEKIIIKDKFGLMRRNNLFEYTDPDFDFDDYDDEDEEEDYLKKDDEYIDEISKLEKE